MGVVIPLIVFVFGISAIYYRKYRVVTGKGLSSTKTGRMATIVEGKTSVLVGLLLIVISIVLLFNFN